MSRILRPIAVAGLKTSQYDGAWTLPARALLEREHRDLDALFGRFLSAASCLAEQKTQRGIPDHIEWCGRTRCGRNRVLQAPAGHKLAPPESEAHEARLHRELRLEHVQVREVSAMIRRLLEEKGDLEGARRLAGNLARRWDAHTTREERELFPTLE
jgi:hypothetical protein